MPLLVRSAQTFDAGFAAPLIQGRLGPVGRALTGTASDEDAAQVIAQLFALRGHRLSFTHALIAELEHRPVGVAVLYRGDFAVPLDDLYRSQLRERGLPAEIQSEGLPGEYYLDTLAVLPEVCGGGIESALLRASLKRAEKADLPLAALVEEGSPAQHLYQQHGLKVAGDLVFIAGHPYQRMRQLGPRIKGPD